MFHTPPENLTDNFSPALTLHLLHIDQKTLEELRASGLIPDGSAGSNKARGDRNPLGQSRHRLGDRHRGCELGTSARHTETLSREVALASCRGQAMSCYQYQLVYGRAEVSAHTRRGWESRCVMDMPHQPRLM